MRARRLLLAIWIAISLSACASRIPVPQQGSLSFACSSSFAPLAAALSDAFKERYPHVAVQVDVGNDANSWERLREGKADLALVAGPREDLPDSWRQRPVALEGLALVVHPSRLLSEVGLAQTQMVFSGRVVFWDALGEQEGAVQPVSRENGSAARVLFESSVMQERAVTSLAIIMPTSAAVVDYVAGHSHAIGYVAAHWAGAGVKTLRVEGTSPLPDAVKQGAYPLVMMGYLIWPSSSKAEAQAFLDFASSPAGRNVIANAGYAVP